jgi:hypothetical protein
MSRSEDDPFGLDRLITLDANDDGDGACLDTFEGESPQLIGLGDEYRADNVELDLQRPCRLDLAPDVVSSLES